MESFFALLQENVLDSRRWTTRQELRLAIVTCLRVIERTYHRRRRRQRPLGKLTPIEFETIYQAAHVIRRPPGSVKGASRRYAMASGHP